MTRTATARKPAPTKSQAPSTATITTLTLPKLAKGEAYAGILIQNGKPAHHVILLPGEIENAPWQKAIDWAKKQGGELPTRKEQALLFANAAEHLQPRWYWSGEQHASAASFAWFQYFVDGYQHYGHKCNVGRARAVRRLPIE